MAVVFVDKLYSIKELPMMYSMHTDCRTSIDIGEVVTFKGIIH